MKAFILIAFVTLACAKNLEQSENLSAYGYNRKISIPFGEKIRKSEEAYLGQSINFGRIAGGSPSQLGQFPYQAGVLTRFIEVNGTGICSGSLVSDNKVIHAAHCWFDGELHGNISEIVLGSTTLFFGGTRIATRNIIMHPHWNPSQIPNENDVAVITLPDPVQFSSIIAPIALPSGSQLNETFDGEVAVASGFGRIGDGANETMTYNQSLRYVSLNVITNEECRQFYPTSVLDSNICTNGTGGAGPCSGDSGGPLAVTRNKKKLLIGITSFGSIQGCTVGFPSAYSRVSSYMDFFIKNL